MKGDGLRGLCVYAKLAKIAADELHLKNMLKAENH